jgi:hypothetical protein
MFVAFPERLESTLKQEILAHPYTCISNPDLDRRVGFSICVRSNRELNISRLCKLQRVPEQVHDQSSV